MKKSLMFFAFLLIIMQSAVYAQFSGGDGSGGNPYQISTPADLDNVRNYMSSNFIQTADIDLGVSPWNLNEGWVPIGTSASRFAGFYNGDGFKIQNLTISRSSTDYVGLFGYAAAATINDVIVENVNITGDMNVGSLAGALSNSTITNCYSTGTLIGGTNLGGLIGLTETLSSTISQNYSSCSVNGDNRVGGLIGGITTATNTSDCYALGSVTASTNNAGGFIGYSSSTTAVVSRSYSAGFVSCGGTNTGGFIGYNAAPANVTYCFWDTTTSGQALSPGGGTGKTSAEMKTQITFTNWDFTTPVWRIYPTLNSGYPYLAWQDMPGILTLIANPGVGGSVTGEGAYADGALVWLTATANAPTYLFLNWTDNLGAIVSTVPDFTFPMPTNDVTLTANFDLYFSKKDLGADFDNLDLIESSVCWGDYDNDGDLDLFESGMDGTGTRRAVILENRGANDFRIYQNFSGVNYSAAAWGDYDNDGDLDLAVTGLEDSFYDFSRIYRNDGSGGFYEIYTDLPGVEDGSIAWADYDNDGDLDVFLCGYNREHDELLSLLYKNTAGTFVSDQNLMPVYQSSAAWGDYDSDGDQDLLVTGFAGLYGKTVVYNNNLGTLEIYAELTGVRSGSGSWGDYDNDGDLDILVTGRGDSDPLSKIYRNDGHDGFIDLYAALIPVYDSSSEFADMNNDGILDIVLSGYSTMGAVTKIYSIASDTVTELDYILLDGCFNGSIAVGDYDNDNDLDLVISGYNISKSKAPPPATVFFKNNFKTINTAPVPPANLSWVLNENDITFSWDRSTDSQTPQYGLSYNLYVGTSPLNGNIQNAMSDNSTGFRKIVALGNAAQVNTWKINDLPLGTYYWSVQAIDHSYIGSDFASEGTFIVSSFTEMSSGLPALQYSSNTWADYDGDNDLDLLVTGYSTAYVTEIYRNDAGIFTDIDAGLAGVRTGSAAWGDYDNDGDPDILLTGNSGAGYISRIYRNDSGSFIDITAGLPGVNNSSAAWGDYDNDGDLDILLTGYIDATNRISNIYRNNAGLFSDISAGLTGVNSGSVAWGDYDNDSDLDILLTGAVSGSRISKIYRNDSGYFFDISAGLTAINSGSAAWGDYDNDGDLDILLSGYNISKVYRNDSGTFNDIGTGLTGLFYSSGAWGDYDNDGDLDILLAGYVNTTTRLTSIYRNDSGWFSNINAGLMGMQDGSAAWADYDNDGDLDIYYNGFNGTVKISKLLRNNSVIKNTIPAAPTGLSTAIHTDGSVTFSWNRASDAQTPQNGLSYNLYIGSVTQGIDQMSPMSGLAAGYRKVINIGNANQCTSWTIKDLPTGHFFWSVQAVDHAFAGSQFAAEQEYSAFTDIAAGIVGIHIGSSDWGDYDSDGDLDILITGYSNTYGPDARIYRNNLNSKDSKISDFTDIGASLPGVFWGSSDWGDYDNDGDLDLVICGYNYSYGTLSRIYRNDSGLFTDISAPLQAVYYSSSDWGDYDNDGDLDLVICGYSGSYGYISKIYRNDAGIFVDVNASIQGVHYSSSEWGDYDNDGDLDLVIAGFSDDGSISKLYSNDAGTFTDTAAPLVGVYYGSLDWGDYDNDGDLDLLLTGYSEYLGRISKIYRNESGAFTDINSTLEAVNNSSAEWGDYDNDGDLDIFLSGYNTSGYSISKLYRNDSGVFVDTGSPLIDTTYSSAVWGDYNNDGKLDILICGYNNYYSNYYSNVYRNNTAYTNTVPSAPTNFTISGKLDNAEFTFSPAPGKSPAESYTYNMDIAIAGVNVKTSMAEHSGYRKIVELGNLNFGNSANKKGPVASSWNLLKSVPNTVLPQEVILVEAAIQSIDNSFAGSDFVTASAYLANRDLKTLPKDIMVSSDELIWELFWSDSLESYTLQMDDDPLFVTPFEETQYLIAKDTKIIYVATALQNLSFFGSLADNTTYYWRVRPNHRNHSKTTVFNSQPDSFRYNPMLSAPLNVTVTKVDGNYVTLTWDAAKSIKADIEYNVYSSALPYAVFPTEWTLEASHLGATTCIVNSTTAKRFFVITSTNDLKNTVIERSSSIK